MTLSIIPIIHDMTDTLIIPDGLTENRANIKIIGVGGGGCNAVTRLYNEGIQNVEFLVCNTDKNALDMSPVPEKIVLGTSLTKGNGAGMNPDVGRSAALESIDELRKAIGPNIEVVFITAGMGGGTGTGAAPVIASMAKKKGILTVAVVTLPFKNEGNESMSKAVDGIRELENNVDSLLIINNEKLYSYYGDLLIQEAFPKADQVLATAVRGVVDIIQSKGFVNVDFEDVKAVMHDSGMALLGVGTGTGPNRIEDAIHQALESPLLNDSDLTTAKNTLINITAGYNDQGLLTKELSNIDDLISKYTGNANRFKRGIVYNYDDDFGDRINITVIATGFKMSTLESMIPANLGNIIIIAPDFEYRKDSYSGGGEIELPDTQASIKIGPSTVYNVRKFHFTEEDRPLLAVRPGDNIAELERVPAIRRRLPSATEQKQSSFRS